MTDNATRDQGSVQRVDWDTFQAAARSAGRVLPIEQSPVWQAFDEAVEGRAPWGRLLYLSAQGRPLALLSLTEMRVRGLTYLWARHGPVWLTGEPAPEQERELRRLLVAGLRLHAPHVVFVRVHATHPAEDLHELLQTMTYDRTVVLDLDVPDDEALLASFKARGRRDVRKALRNQEITHHDETGRADEVFDELYEVLTETGDRDGFRPAPKSSYLAMLHALGPRHARLYVARHHGGRALAWSLVTVHDGEAMRYYAGSTQEGRRLRAADALVYREACWLRSEGVRRYDLMGVDSPRVPELAGVREFKSKFVQDGPVDVPGAWDVPVRPRLHAALVRAARLKRALVDRLRDTVGRRGGERGE
ncbi:MULTISPECIES: GNAT family N-acetyltransferase [unclassified Actinomyces]|uniref:lipid II:glycine glycyltransferase FemX n=1 Tax=unclassified Actinomyces TaxID=2609248 RepID=UPI002016A855|nr:MULTISPECIES: GNAT family N-acetyltransferase [unclassified Actinomyces]MCL3778361.1 GNAT family N-acetyltransferase [Actinomyces sp. AC-20-1]MCL3789949.1 GNAT family N-acetyltransferase [Actinomyces sp. 187325]MCL3792172.1 GNAT family N-acetyltransferase [Actinomyces sp. 186855]MCL3794333.1 GNAT family N-acetyltransferase [Actinomyces sp. 217892]